jgi:hypothetical protein
MQHLEGSGTSVLYIRRTVLKGYNNNIYLLQMGCRPVAVVTYLATNSRDGRVT